MQIKCQILIYLSKWTLLESKPQHQLVFYWDVITAYSIVEYLDLGNFPSIILTLILWAGHKSLTLFSGFPHRLQMPWDEVVFTKWRKIHSHSQIFRYGRSIFCLPHWPKLSYFFDLCLHFTSVVRGLSLSWGEIQWYWNNYCQSSFCTANLFKAIVTFSIMGSNQKVT